METGMSGLVHEVAAAADLVQPSSDHHLLMLRHHLCEALAFSQELGMKMASTDLCQILRMLEE
ncbi:MAG: hypothetical protein VW891_05520 [Novosphingobium sp.]